MIVQPQSFEQGNTLLFFSDPITANGPPVPYESICQMSLSELEKNINKYIINASPDFEGQDMLTLQDNLLENLRERFRNFLIEKNYPSLFNVVMIYV